MTVKEAILKTLEDLGELVNSTEVTNHIISKKYYPFDKALTPSATVSAQLGDFIRFGDTRIKRIKKSGIFYYYLAIHEPTLNIDEFLGSKEKTPVKPAKEEKVKSYDERDLHKLLSSYLKNTGTYSKTIYHEQSNAKDSNQIWTHPDMVGIRFLTLQTKVSQEFLKSINRVDTFKISSYELKKEISSDADLKKAYFQAVSNSSWANYGYLVAFEISDSLADELERLNQSFGIGVIELHANPYQSKVKFPALYRDLDFRTIDKLCKINPLFSKFIEHTETLMTAEDKVSAALWKDFVAFCDSYFMSDKEVEDYCREKHIPTDEQ